MEAVYVVVGLVAIAAAYGVWRWRVPARIDRISALEPIEDLIVCGDLDEASSRLECSEHASTPHARFLCACIAVSQRNDDEAADHLSNVPDDPAVRVLRRLTAGAPSGSAELFSAWVDAGRPDLECSRLLRTGSTESFRALPVPAGATATALHTFVTQLTTQLVAHGRTLTVDEIRIPADLEHHARLIATSARTESPLRALAASVLHMSASPDSFDAWKAIAASEPNNLFFALRLLADQPPPRIDVEEVERLERLAERSTRYDWYYSEIYAAVRDELTPIAGSVEGRFRAMNAATLVQGAFQVDLFTHLLNAPTEAHLQERKCVALHRLLLRMMEARTLVDRIIASSLLESLGERCGAERSRRAQAARDALARFYCEAVKPFDEARWPLSIPPERLDLAAADEVGYYEHRLRTIQAP